ncbi:hypothetical protein IP69_13540 [Bosea sp. AAP35]|uniref:hypothetical protein n=1 Tax=Bosea sp. AAP35 TaxID=1523417 RepID=UPI0006B9AF17|nr:hypothetical protein [Bosea sp. AAP35]KPF67364.1 hypothetical protein IP69_13540 [Bosea sp. AAP35]
MNVDIFLTAICGLLVNAVLFGIGATAVLAIPALSVEAFFWLPVVVVVSLVLSPFLGIWIARRLRVRNWGRKGWLRGDKISG